MPAVSAPFPSAAAQPSRPSRNARSAALLRALRKGHAWVGLAGASFGLLFGVTGFLMNHRAILKIESGEIQEHKVTLELPEAPSTPAALAQLLATRFGLAPERVKWRVQAARPGHLGGAPVTASEQWSILFSGYAHFARASYIPGNHSIEVEQRDANLAGTLMRLHKAGILLWSRFSGPRMLAAGLSMGALALGLAVALRSW